MDGLDVHEGEGETEKITDWMRHIKNGRMAERGRQRQRDRETERMQTDSLRGVYQSAAAAAVVAAAAAP